MAKKKRASQQFKELQGSVPELTQPHLKKKAKTCVCGHTQEQHSMFGCELVEYTGIRYGFCSCPEYVEQT